MGDFDKFAKLFPPTAGIAGALDVNEPARLNAGVVQPKAPTSFRGLGEFTKQTVENVGQVRRNIADQTFGNIEGAARTVAYPFKEFAEGYSPTPAQTNNAVATATQNLPAANSPNNPALDRPNFPTELAQSQQNMRNGDIQVITQDAGYPGARGGAMPAGLPRAIAPNYEFADFNTIKMDGGTGGGSPGGGSFDMFTPGVQKQLGDLSTRADALLSSRSMVDNWRGRQAAKMRDRMMLSEAAMGNTRVGAAQARANMLSSQASALRAANEVPLAQMHDYTARRGQDVQGDLGRLRAETDIYGYDTRAATEERAQNIDAQKNVGQMATGQYTAKALDKGDFASIRELSEATGHYPPRDVGQKVSQPDVRGGVWITEPGKPERYRLPPMEDPAALDRKRKELGYGK